MQSTEIQNVKMDVELRAGSGSPDAVVTKTNATATAEMFTKKFRNHEAMIHKLAEHSAVVSERLNKVQAENVALRAETQMLTQRTEDLFQAVQRLERANGPIIRAIKYIHAKQEETRTMVMMHDQVVGPEVDEFMSNRKVCDALAKVLGFED